MSAEISRVVRSSEIPKVSLRGQFAKPDVRLCYREHLNTGRVLSTNLHTTTTTSAATGIMSPHFDEVQADLRADPQIKWGFVVYRCTYGDDTAWARMMDRLNRQAQRSLESEGAGDLFSQIDWAVQENLEWDEAEPDLIKQ